MKMMRVRAVWTTNVVALLLGVGMYGMFITLPQFVQTSPQAGYGFGASLTGSGLFLLPNAATMLVVAPFVGVLTSWVGSKVVLIAGGLFGTASYVLLALAHSQPWNIYLATALLGVGIALAFSAMTNVIVEAVPAAQTGVATGMNSNIRTIGGATGSAIALSIIVSDLLPSGIPSEHGFVAAFAFCAVAMAVATGVGLLIPRRRGAEAEGHVDTSWVLAEAEVFAGTVPLAPEVPS
jgi:MFS family permease